MFPDLCGDPIILEIGGPAYLLPLAQRDKFYNIATLLHRIHYYGNAFVIGAGAGLWPHTTDGSNCEVRIIKVTSIELIFLISINKIYKIFVTAHCTSSYRYTRRFSYK